jgi:hypothetical protein
MEKREPPNINDFKEALTNGAIHWSAQRTYDKYAKALENEELVSQLMSSEEMKKYKPLLIKLKNRTLTTEEAAVNMDKFRLMANLAIIDANNLLKINTNVSASLLKDETKLGKLTLSKSQEPGSSKGGADHTTYKGRKYKVRTGKKGGKFILVGADKKKVYI